MTETQHQVAAPSPPEVPAISREPNEDELKLIGLDQPLGLINRILPQLGLKLLDTKRATTGNNTSTFILTCTSAPITIGKSEEIKLAGTSSVPVLGEGESIRVVFSTSKVQVDMDAVVMVQNRVAAMQLAREGLKGRGVEKRLVPRVYGWSDGKGVEGGQTWCLMEYLTGESCGTSSHCLWSSDMNCDQGVLS